MYRRYTCFRRPKLNGVEEEESGNGIAVVPTEPVSLASVNILCVQT